MRPRALAAIVVAATGCSSAPRPAPPAPDDVARASSPVDAGAPSTVPPPVDATPEVACDRGTLRALAGDAIVLCDDDELEPACRAYAADGSVADPGPSQEPTADLEDDGAAVTVCTAAHACTTVTPGGGELDAVALDAGGQRVAIVIGDELSVWSAATGKRVARGQVADGDDVAFLGDRLLVISEDDAGMRGALWKIAGKKLKRVAALDGALRGWTVIAPDVGVLALGGELVVVDLGTGERTGTVDWAALLDETPDDVLALAIAGAAGKLAVVVDYVTADDWERSRAGVFAFDGTTPRRYAIPICEGVIYDRHVRTPSAACLKNPLGCSD